MFKTVRREILRDELIDLRDECRDYWRISNRDMNEPAYAVLRDMLNGQLFETQHLRFIGFVYFLAHSNRDVISARATPAERIFKKCDDETKEKIESIRKRSRKALVNYILSTSTGFIGGLVVFLFSVVLYLLPAAVGRSVKGFIRNTFAINTQAIECASGAYAH
jgi:hypothetical protein